jgi:protease I
MTAAHGPQVGFVVANEGVERVELTEPWTAVEKAGGTPVLIAPEDHEVQTFDHLDQAASFPVDVTTSAAQVDDFDALVLPGGVANPDQLRTDGPAVHLIRSFVESGKPVAAICHAPWTLIEAGVVDGRRLTSWPSLRTDITNAGGTWTDEQVVIDGNLITSRNPDDLDAFCAALVDAIGN